MKKFFACLVFVAFLIFSCAGLGLNKADTHSVKFGPSVYTMPNAVPIYSEWDGNFAPLSMNPGFGVVRWEASNPKNSDEVVLVLLAIEDRNSDNASIYVMVVVHVVSFTQNKLKFYADMQYLNTGKPSFELTEQPKAPNIEKFIVMKEAQFAKKVGI